MRSSRSSSWFAPRTPWRRFTVVDMVWPTFCERKKVENTATSTRLMTESAIISSIRVKPFARASGLQERVVMARSIRPGAR
jgi:hypothetical protein